MKTITRIILRFWTIFVSIFGNAAEKSKKTEASDFHRTISVRFELAGRFLLCDIVPHRDEKGRFHCAILLRVGSAPLMPRMVQQVAEYVARDFFRRSPESLGWIYIPYGSRRKPVIPEDVLELQFVPRGTNGDFRVAWSAASPEVADAWIVRTASTLEFARRIRVR